MLISQSNLSKSRGFSLIELMLTVVIIGMVLAFAVPSYRQWIENSKIRNAAESILNGIQRARAEAVLNNAPVQFAFGANSDWTVGCVAGTTTCPATIEQRATAEGSAASVTVTKTGGTTVVFNNLGIRTTGLTQVDIDTTALSAADSRELRIEVGLSGAARLCDPEFTLPDPKGCKP